MLAAPGLTAAFGVFRAYSVDGSTDVARQFWTTWASQLRRSLGVGAVVGGGVVVIGVDLVVVAGSAAGATFSPLLIVILGVLLSTALLTLVLSVERPQLRLRDVGRAALYLSVRRWYLTLPSLVVLAALGALFTLQPAHAVGLAATPLLYAVWGNSRYTLRPVVPAGSQLSSP